MKKFYNLGAWLHLFNETDLICMQFTLPSEADSPTGETSSGSFVFAI